MSAVEWQACLSASPSMRCVGIKWGKQEAFVPFRTKGRRDLSPYKNRMKGRLLLIQVVIACALRFAHYRGAESE
jgi:hypothetical protein